ncbi:hypothetical protein NDU88_005327 [Pleurodeles waltl]|uniref:Uncharacterized protein n=1 Tax=Pleurodeles waltl TaxID=8319 RepID=A0AAV7UIL0_PLEWA|nr:hypothetical protein NDU88_005327 [Pleurodeles waltl]
MSTAYQAPQTRGQHSPRHPVSESWGRGQHQPEAGLVTSREPTVRPDRRPGPAGKDPSPPLESANRPAPASRGHRSRHRSSPPTPAHPPPVWPHLRGPIASLVQTGLLPPSVSPDTTKRLQALQKCPAASTWPSGRAPVHFSFQRAAHEEKCRI